MIEAGWIFLTLCAAFLLTWACVNRWYEWRAKHRRSPVVNVRVVKP